MKICGIVLAKSESKRLPNKNFMQLGCKKVYEYAKDALWDYDTYVFGESFGNRPPAASLNDEPLFSALKWAYKSLPERYDAIICIMANCPQITAKEVSLAVDRFKELGCDELRSFAKNGKESGLIIVKEAYLLEKHEISTYQAAIEIEATEIHDIDDFRWVETMMP